MENEKLNETVKKVWDSLTDEQKAKAKECKTSDELIALFGEIGVVLPDDLLDAVSGGIIPDPYMYSWYASGDMKYLVKCRMCPKVFVHATGVTDPNDPSHFCCSPECVEKYKKQLYR